MKNQTLILTALAALTLSVTAAAAPFTTPHTFAPGTAIKAADMNDNFGAAQTELRRLDEKMVAVVHESTAANISSNWTCIDNAASNGNPNALVFVTHNYNPGGAGGNYSLPTAGVWYTSGKWCIYYEDTSKTMPAGITFNVLIVRP
ncbi:hypothetical protein [Deinococcus marmoris]|uniref:DUF7452 domain-containing protein n=1 Tax=Deinococcus marmoris TaxID=249408 RepID=UPI00049721AD|nr:hypothetical protein [Deinococcus marmoris]